MTRTIKHIARTILFFSKSLMLLCALGLSLVSMASPGIEHHGLPGKENAPRFYNAPRFNTDLAFNKDPRFNFSINIVITKNFALADGTQQNIVTVTITNGGTPVPGLNVTFSINGGGVSQVIATNSSGVSALYLASMAAGPATIDIIIGGIHYGPEIVTFVAAAGPPDLTNPLTALVVDIGTNSADGVSQDKVHAHVVDANSNPVAGAVVVFTVVGGTAGATATIVGTGITDANGDAYLTITDPTIGTVNISATIGGTQIFNSPATVNFVVGPPDPTNPLTELLTDVVSSPDDGVSQDIVHAHVVDATGNPVPGVTVVFTIIGGTAGGSAVTTLLGTGVTDAAGNVFLAITNTVAGTVQITATIGGTTINNTPATVKFVASAPAPSNPLTILVVDIGSTTADGVSQDIVHAHVVDATGNAVPGATVVFTVTGGTAGGTAVITGTGTTDISGNAVLDITNLKVGTVFISATIGGVAINNSPATVVFVAGAPDPTNPQTALITDVASNTADGVSTDQVHAHVVDANGNPVAGTTVVFTVTGGTASGTAATTLLGTGVTDANGDVTLTITNTQPGTVIIAATIGGTAINNSPATVTFVTGAPDPSNPLTQLLVDVVSSPADGVSQDIVHAHVVDATGNPVPGVTVVFSVTGGTASGTAVTTLLGTGVTDANGNVFLAITNNVAGTVQMSAAIGGTTISGSPSTVVFKASAPDVTNPQTKLVVDVTGVPADGTSTCQVHAHIVDATGNAVSGATVVFSIASGTANFVGTTTITTDASGNATITLTSMVPGSVDITATVNGIAIMNNSPASVLFDDMPDPSNPLTALSVIANDAFADGQSTNSVQAHIVDQNGNVLAGQHVTFTIATGNGTIITIQPVITDANGNAVIQLTSKIPGDVTVTATVEGKPIVFGSPAKVHFVAINIYVPHVFTPNGDGTNDVLKPILVGIADFHYFSIYNRWGNLIFTTQDPNQGWDGKFKGVAQPVETYLWIAEGITTEGNKIVQKGMVSLVR